MTRWLAFTAHAARGTALCLVATARAAVRDREGTIATFERAELEFGSALAALLLTPEERARADADRAGPVACACCDATAWPSDLARIGWVEAEGGAVCRRCAGEVVA